MASDSQTTGLRTDPRLLKVLLRMAAQPATYAEMRVQRISWCVGQTNAPRDLIERMLRDG